MTRFHSVRLIPFEALHTECVLQKPVISVRKNPRTYVIFVCKHRPQQQEVDTPCERAHRSRHTKRVRLSPLR